MKMETDAGFPTIGARNVMACIGGIHCIKANINTQDMAKKIEQEVFPSHYHIKAAVAGCPNDCAKGHFNDFGIMGVNKQDYDIDRSDKADISQRSVYRLRLLRKGLRIPCDKSAQSEKR